MSTIGPCDCNVYNGGKPLVFPPYKEEFIVVFENTVAPWREWVLMLKGYAHVQKVDRIISNLRWRWMEGRVTTWKPPQQFTGEPLCKSKGCPKGQATWSPDCECSQCHLECE